MKKSKANLRQKILSDRTIRRAITQQSHYWFFHIFLTHYVKHETALFQREMFQLTEDETYKMIAVMAFRGSAKSTIMNLSYAIWSVLGRQQKKFVFIISKTQNQAKAHFQNIKYELEHNELLKNDLGPFTADSDQWGMHSLEIHKLGAKITCVSREQSIRGMRHGPRRPDLLICDDIEDSLSVQTSQERDLTFRWFSTEVVPMIDSGARIIILGNLLHERSFMMSMADRITKGTLPGIFRAYPLIDDLGQILWPGKFPTTEAIKALYDTITDRATLQQEYLLRFFSGLNDAIPFIIFDESPSEEGRNRWKNGIKQYPQRSLGKYRISAPVVLFTTKVMGKTEHDRFQKWLRGF